MIVVQGDEKDVAGIVLHQPRGLVAVEADLGAERREIVGEVYARRSDKDDLSEHRRSGSLRFRQGTAAQSAKDLSYQEAEREAETDGGQGHDIERLLVRQPCEALNGVLAPERESSGDQGQTRPAQA